MLWCQRKKPCEGKPSRGPIWSDRGHQIPEQSCCSGQLPFHWLCRCPSPKAEMHHIPESHFTLVNIGERNRTVIKRELKLLYKEPGRSSRGNEAWVVRQPYEALVQRLWRQRSVLFDGLVGMTGRRTEARESLRCYSERSKGLRRQARRWRWSSWWTWKPLFVCCYWDIWCWKSLCDLSIYRDLGGKLVGLIFSVFLNFFCLWCWLW